MAYTAKQIAAALRRSKGAVYLAAEALDCSHSTIYNWARRSPMVQEVIDEERGKLLDIGELRLYAAVEDGQPWAVAFLLKTIGKHRGYTEKTENENTLDMTIREVSLPAKAQKDEWTALYAYNEGEQPRPAPKAQ